MDVHPTAYPVQQMSQQLPYSHPYPYPTPASKPPPPLQIQPQQPLDHTQFFPGTFPPNNKQQQLYHPQQQQPQQQQHQLFPTQQAYPQLQQPSQSFYGNPENPQFSGNGVMQTAAQNGKSPLMELLTGIAIVHAAPRPSYLPAGLADAEVLQFAPKYMLLRPTIRL